MVHDSLGKVVTVRGVLDPADLGITSMHEHLLVDTTKAWLREPQTAIERKLAHERISLENLFWVRSHYLSNVDNMRIADFDETLREVREFKREGGKTIVEVSSKGLSPDYRASRTISVKTGLNIIAGTGYYVSRSHPPNMNDRSIEDLATEMREDIEEGFGESGVRAGIIGEIGVAGIADRQGGLIHKNEEKVLRAAGRAQAMSGAAVSVHPPRSPDIDHPTSFWCLQILDMLVEEGASPDKVIIGHCDRPHHELNDLVEITRRGAYVELDTWGLETYNEMILEPRYSDTQRVNLLRQLIENGCIDRILLGQDMYTKVQRSKYGGHGYGHLLRRGLPLMKRSQITTNQIESMLVQNPMRVLPLG